MNDIVKRINSAKHIVVMAHLNPDADSLGSASAVYTYLLTLHKKVSFYCASKSIDKKLSFLPWFNKIRDTFPLSVDLAISLDCADISRIDVELNCDLINIDHHKSNPSYAQYNLIDSSCISTTQVLYNFFEIHKIPINKKMATALYAGLLDDSNCFISNDMDGIIFAVARELIELGADYKICNKFVMKYQTLAGLRLKVKMFTNMNLLSDARVALFLVTQEDMKETGAIDKECEVALEEALFLPTVEISVLLRENKDLSIKGSLRSKGDIDLSNISLKLSGGGHKYRAGFEIDSKYSLQEASVKVLKFINEEI